MRRRHRRPSPAVRHGWLSAQTARPGCILAASLAILALASCSGVLRDELAPGAPAARTAVAQPRQDGMTVTLGAIRGTEGCELQYLLYAPPQPHPAKLVVVGHGFLRSFEQMDGHARRLAAAGLRTASVRFCNTRIWDGHHRRNGRDMVALADALGAERVVYVGFSAGGLAALVAGREDPRTLGVVTLDLVDRDDMGRLAASGLDRPLIGLVAPPSPCNAEGNGLAALAASPRAEIQRFPEATHCDFEAPTDWLCTRLCGTHPGSEARRAAILRATTAAVVAVARTQGPSG